MVNTLKVFEHQSHEEAYFKNGLPQHSRQTDQVLHYQHRVVQNQSTFALPLSPNDFGPVQSPYTDAMFEQCEMMAASPTNDVCVLSDTINSTADDSNQYYRPIQTYTRNHTSSGNSMRSLDDSIPIPRILAEDPSPMQRQYSMNTVMEVIDTHDISDVSFPTPPELSWAGKMQTHSNYPTQPINIKKIQNETNLGQFDVSSPPSWDLLHQTSTKSYLPAFDEGKNQHACSPAYSLISNSPMPQSFQYYQYDSDIAPSFQYNNGTFDTSTNLPTPKNYPNDFGDNMFPAKELMISPASNSAPSNCSSWNWASRLENMDRSQPFTPDILASPESSFQFGDTFNSFDHPHGDFKGSQSCPNFIDSNNPLSPSALQENLQVGSSSVPRISRPHALSTSSLCAEDMSHLQIADSPFGVKLEEIDSSIFADELENETTDQERLDLRRKRNNRACRASRHRRKMHKEAQERRAGCLQEENKQLKAEVKRLEKECQEVKLMVRRRMSSS